MQKKVLVVDDSALMRRVLSDIIDSDTRFHVTKTANNGLEALDILLKGETFDAIVLDINMPKLSGLEFLKELDTRGIKATCIVVSTVAKEGAKETIYALELGAFDFVTKPDNFYQVRGDQFKERLLEVIALATKQKVEPYSFNNESKNVSPVPSMESPIRNILARDTQEKDIVARELQTKEMAATKVNDLPVRMPVANRRSYGSSPNRIVALACSTGGPKALQQVVPLLPENLNCSFLIVQHMPEGFTYSLAHRLNEISKVTVKEAEHGEVLQNGVVYIAKGGKQMRVISERGVNKLSITEEPPRNSLKPCADIMYESLATADFDDILCVVLTGMGSDGTSGIRQLCEMKSTYVIAQDEDSSTVYGMPRVVIEAGLANEIVSLGKITEAITKNLGVS